MVYRRMVCCKRLITAWPIKRLLQMNVPRLDTTEDSPDKSRMALCREQASNAMALANGRLIFTIFASLAILAVAGLVVSRYEPRDLLRGGILEPLVVTHFAMFDSTGQRRAHALLFVITVAAAICIEQLGRVWKLPFVRLGQSRWMDITILVGLTLWAGLLWRDLWYSNPLGLAIGHGFAAVCLLRPRWLLHPPGGKLWQLGALALAIGVSVPVFILPCDLSNKPPDFIVSTQIHYYHVVGASDRLAAGEASSPTSDLSYGALLPVMVGGWQRLVNPLSFGELRLVVAGLSFLFLLLNFLAFRLYVGRCYFAIFFGLAFVVPWLHFAHHSLLFPNQSGWRALGFAAAPLGMVLTRNLSENLRSAWIGGLAMLLLLINFESGLALSAGMAVYLVARLPKAPNRRSWMWMFARQTAIGIGAGLIVLCVFVTLQSLLLGSLAKPAETVRLVLGGLRGFSSSGVGGLRLRWDPVAALILLHSLCVIFWTATGRRPVSFRQAFRLGIATILVVWFAYYANRPDPWNLWTLLSLYAFIAVDILTFAISKSREVRNRTLSPTIALTILALLVVPHLVLTNGRAWKEMKNSYILSQAPLALGTREVSDVYFAPEVANEIEVRATALASIPRTDDAVALGASAYLVAKVARRPELLRYGDGFTDTFTRARYEALVKELRVNGPKTLYMDAPHLLLSGGKVYEDYYARLKADLAGVYRIDGQWYGWHVLRRQ